MGRRGVDSEQVGAAVNARQLPGAVGLLKLCPLLMLSGVLAGCANDADLM
jgi:hypothetical protein